MKRLTCIFVSVCMLIGVTSIRFVSPTVHMQSKSDGSFKTYKPNYQMPAGAGSRLTPGLQASVGTASA